MIIVNKIWEGVRQEGLNYGLPTTFLELGDGVPYSTTEELVKTLMTNTKCKWICIRGESTTQVGMGTLVRGLAAVGLYVEIECKGDIKDPGWLNAVDRWVVDYMDTPHFNMGALRSKDMIRYTVNTKEELPKVEVAFAQHKGFTGTKYIKSGDKELIKACFEFVRKWERGRLYLC